MRHLIVFTRAPEKGKVKTRLAEALGADAALAFHIACLRGVLEEAAQVIKKKGGRGYLYFRGEESAFKTSGVPLPSGFSIAPQNGETLGDRMHRAMAEVMATDPEPCCILVGSDLPLLNRAHLEEAFVTLEQQGPKKKAPDVVLGPTPDGGYYLIGLKKPAPELFQLPAWGEGPVAQNTLSQAEALGLSLKKITALPDVDTVADGKKLLTHPDAPINKKNPALKLIRTWEKS